jgi:hypothetical protein
MDDSEIDVGRGTLCSVQVRFDFNPQTGERDEGEVPRCLVSRMMQSFALAAIFLRLGPQAVSADGMPTVDLSLAPSWVAESAQSTVT